MSRDFFLFLQSKLLQQGSLTPATRRDEDYLTLCERRLAPRFVDVVARFGAELIISQPRRQMRWQCADNLMGGYGRPHIRWPSNYINNILHVII